MVVHIRFDHFDEQKRIFVFFPKNFHPFPSAKVSKLLPVKLLVFIHLKKIFPLTVQAVLIDLMLLEHVIFI